MRLPKGIEHPTDAMHPIPLSGMLIKKHFAALAAVD
jgi:hypothetical protein